MVSWNDRLSAGFDRHAKPKSAMEKSLAAEQTMQLRQKLNHMVRNGASAGHITRTGNQPIAYDHLSKADKKKLVSEAFNPPKKRMKPAIRESFVTAAEVKASESFTRW